MVQACNRGRGLAHGVALLRSNALGFRRRVHSRRNSALKRLEPCAQDMAAVDDEVLTRDVVGGLGSEEQERPVQILDALYVTQRSESAEEFALFGRTNRPESLDHST